MVEGEDCVHLQDHLLHRRLAFPGRSWAEHSDVVPREVGLREIAHQLGQIEEQVQGEAGRGEDPQQIVNCDPPSSSISLPTLVELPISSRPFPDGVVPWGLQNFWPFK